MRPAVVTLRLRDHKVSMSIANIFPGQPVIGQIFKLIDVASVNRTARRAQADRYCKSFMTLDHLYTMMFVLMANTCSLREVVTGFSGASSRLGQIGMRGLPTRSNLSDANARRSSDVFGEIYHSLAKHFSRVLPDSRMDKELIKRAKIIDSTTIQLYSEILRTTGRNPADGKRKGGIKVHTMLDAAAGIPRCIYFSEATAHDSKYMEKMYLLPGDIAVFDKGYVNYPQYKKWMEAKIHFVTRQKDNAKCKVIERRKIPLDAKGKILHDQIVRVRINKTGETITLRRVKYKDPTEGKVYIFWTSLLHISALNVAAFYKSRWSIETFFKLMKQNFNLKYFLGDNENAIKIQIWVCMIVNLLYQVLLHQSKRKWAFSNFCSFVRIHLWSYIFLSEFLNDNEYEMRKKLEATPQMPTLFSG